MKTILVHAANDDQFSYRLELARDLARNFQSRIRVLYMNSPMTMPVQVTGRGASAAYIAHEKEMNEKKSGEVKAFAEKYFQDVDSDWEWEEHDGHHNKILSDRSHYADLIIVSQGKEGLFSGVVDIYPPHELLLHATCAVLVVPHHSEVKQITCKHVMVAWKDSACAARSVRYALPILQSAERVSLFVAKSKKIDVHSGKELQNFLASYDIKSEMVSVIPEHKVGEEILNHKKSCGADLLVMGAYGHWRWREAILGGATQYIMKHMKTPVLMAH